MSNNRIFTIVFLFISNNACSQERVFNYKEVPPEYQPKSKELRVFKKEVRKIKNDAFDLTGALPKNFAKDGSVDYTATFQKMINLKDTLIFPNYPFLINKSGLNIPSNKTIIFKNKTVLLLEPTALQSYQVLRLHDIENTVIYYPQIVGDRDIRLGPKGEWGMGISIKGSKNVKIVNPKISNCWGDGIYIGTTSKINTNINIYYPIIDNCRRNGISVISCLGLLIENPVVSNTNGTLPSCGIDFEPNTNNDIINNIVINNPVTYNNFSSGITTYLRAHRGDEKRELNMKINNPIDRYSRKGFSMAEPNAKEKTKQFIGGKIIITNPDWKHNKEPYTFNNNKYSPNVTIIN